jgi:hypothetical protein
MKSSYSVLENRHLTAVGHMLHSLRDTLFLPKLTLTSPIGADGEVSFGTRSRGVCSVHYLQIKVLWA